MSKGSPTCGQVRSCLCLAHQSQDIPGKMSDISDVDGAQFARTYRLWSRWFLVDSQRLSVFPRVQIPSKRGGLFALPFRDKIAVAKVSYHRLRKALFHPWSRSTTQQIWRSFKYGLHFVSYRVIYTWNHWKMSYIIHCIHVIHCFMIFTWLSLIQCKRICYRMPSSNIWTYLRCWLANWNKSASQRQMNCSK